MKHIRALLLPSLIVLAACSACSSSDPEADPDPDPIPAKAGYELVWNDEFDADQINPSYWTFWVTGNPFNAELQYYTNRDQNARIENGVLVIEAHEEDYSGSDGRRDYTSARMNTAGKADFKYGRFEIRAKLPFGQGMWPAIWMMPTYSEYGGWAASGEIDIMEMLGHEPTKTYGTLHYGGEGNAGRASSGGSYTLPSGTFFEDFHVFALEWEEGLMRWYVDDVMFQTKTSWFTRGHDFPAPFDKEFHFILNLAVGGNWPGDPDASTIFPQRMEVDYVRAFRKTVGDAVPRMIETP